MTTTHSSWEISEYQGRAGFDQLETDWRRIYAAIPLRTVFLSFEAWTAYLENIQPASEQLRCLALSDGRQVRAICVVEPRLDSRVGFKVPVWGLVWQRHSHQADVLCADDEARRALLPALTAHLRRNPEGRRLLMLGPAPTASAFWDGLDGLHAGDFCINEQESVRILDCTDPAGDAKVASQSKYRAHLRRCRRRLEVLPDARFATVRDPAGLNTDLDTFMDLEASGWKGETGTRTALRFRTGSPGYYRHLAAHLTGAADHCEINSLYANGACIASMIGTRTGGTYSALKICYDETHHRLSPGMLLTESVLGRCFADPEILQVDLVSPSAWFRGWSSSLVPLQLVYVNLDGWFGRVLIALLNLRYGSLRRLARWIRAHWPGKAKAIS